MKISAVDTFVLGADLASPFGFSQWYYQRRMNVIVKISTDEGIAGWGECYGPASLAAEAVNGFYRELLIGLDPRQHEQVWAHLWQRSLDYARKGPMMAALSGIDIALWDIKAKSANMPLWMLLGGKGGAIPCYATGMYFKPAMGESEMMTALLKEADGYIREGFRMIKIKIGKNIAFDKKLIIEFRKKFPDLCIAADANHAYNFKEAVDIGRCLSDNGYAWFEEPLSPENIADHARLRECVTVPIAGGECEQTRYGFAALANVHALDIMQPDIAYCGGITEYQKIAAIASAAHIDMMPHCWGLRINQAVAASAITALPANPGRYEKREVSLEMDRTEHPVRDGIFSRWHEVKNGSLILNDAPGIGVDIDEARIKRFVPEAP
ncbi:MAG: mandelate racemase/muconate lactonizing enzyme family protein [Spirochaetota bacterium]